MYLGSVNRPAAASWSSPDPSRLTSINWPTEADLLSSANRES